MDLVVNCFTDGLLNRNIVNKLLCPHTKHGLQPGSMILSIFIGHKNAFTNSIYPLYKKEALMFHKKGLSSMILPDDTVLCMQHDNWKIMVI